MRKHRLIIAAVAVGALALTGCASTTDAKSGGSSGVVSAWSTEPERGLVPGDTNEAGGGLIVNQLFAGLIYYDAKGVSHNDVAESITTEDSQHFTVKLKSGQKFSDGEAVTASSFVDAWNYTANVKNGHKAADFFQDVEGFSRDVDSDLTGLKVVSDTEFTITLASKVSDFAQRLGANAFFPLPESAYDDMKTFGQHSVGNGPYQFKSSSACKHDEQLELSVNKNYTGPQKPKNDGLKLVFYSNPDSAYRDVQAGNLDVLYQILDSAVSTYASDFPDRNANQPAAVQQSFTIPQNLERFQGEEGALRRQAISLSINRPEITKVIFGGTRTSSTDFSAPTIAGYQKDLPGLDAFAISPWTGTFKLAYNADGGHQGWVDAVSNGIKNTLGIEAEGAPVPTFGAFRDQITKRTIGSSFRSGWQGDYPGLYNFLGPVFGTGGGSNDGEYSNPAFDALLKKGLAEPDEKAAAADFAKAQQILFTDLPQVSLWYQNVTAVWSGSVSDVTMSWNSFPVFTDIVKN